MKRVILIAVICVLVAFGGYAFMQSQQSNPANKTSTPDINSDPFITSTPDTNSLRMGGSSFRDPRDVYTILYPNDYQLHTDDPIHTRISKTGPTQQGQTEMYDGVVVVFESIDLQGQSLEAFVDARIQQSTADGTLEVIQPKKVTTLNSYPGYTYTMRGLGTSTY
ncbi:MAG TPA: hypothetical protein PLD54_04255, partial [Candidatus Levybacteria bacterium]|nr:hypothetical protein [Candidatus Levybacteria bacterium]